MVFGGPGGHGGILAPKSNFYEKNKIWARLLGPSWRPRWGSKFYIYGRVYFVPVIEGKPSGAARFCKICLYRGNATVFREWQDVLRHWAANHKNRKKKKYRGWSYSNREGIDEKLKSMALPYKTKVRKKWPNKFSTEKRQNTSEIDVLKIARNSRTLWWSGIKF